MASNYKFSKEEMAAIKAARRETKDKRADAISDDPIIFFEPLCRAGGDVYFVVHVNHSYRVL